MDFTQYEDYFIKSADLLLSIDSLSGFTNHAASYILDMASEMGYPAYRNKI